MKHVPVNDALKGVMEAGLDRRELHLRLAIVSTQEEVSAVTERISKWLGCQGADQDVVDDVQLAVAEALNNVVEHAYVYREDGRIDLLLVLEPQSISVDITDFGCKFDGPPPYRPRDPASIELEDLPEGGWGWGLIQMVMQKVDFEHRNGCNHLTMVRMIEVQAEET